MVRPPPDSRVIVLRSSKSAAEKLLVRSDEATHVVGVGDIRAITTGPPNHVRIHLASAEIVVRGAIHRLSRILGLRFVRVNRSALVNTTHVVRLSPAETKGPVSVRTDTGLLLTAGRSHSGRVRAAFSFTPGPKRRRS